jgi:HEAT repeat protein
MAKHTDVALREAAVFTLGRAADLRALPALLAALADSRPSVQALACLGLGRLTDGRARTAVEKRTADARTPDLVRAACAVGLADDGVAAIAPLAAALADNAGETQRVAAWALGQIGDKRALPALWAAYFRRVDQDRTTIAWAIARLAGGTAAVGAGPDAATYPMRAGKLDLAGMVRELPGELPDSEIPIAAIVGHEREIAAAIEIGLGSHRDEALSVLTDLDTRDDGLGLGAIVPIDPTPAVTAALASIGTAIGPAVIRRAADDDMKVAARALAVAAKIGGPEAAAAVEKALRSPSHLVRSTATASIARLHARGAMTPALRAALVAQLGSSEHEDRQNAAAAMGGLGADADVDALVKALRDPWAYVRDAAATSLGRLRTTTAGPALLTATDDVNPAVRASAARALIAIGDPRAKARLAELAESDPDETVRSAASGH